MGRGPNSRGGKNNNNKLNMSARARFSNWKPNYIKLEEKFDKKRKELERRIELNNDSTRDAHPLPDGIKPDSVIDINLPNEILLKVHGLLKLTQIAINPIRTNVSPQKTEEMEIISQTDSKITLHSQSNESFANVIPVALVQRFLTLGFEKEEIIFACEGLTAPETVNQNLFLVAILMSIFPDEAVEQGVGTYERLSSSEGLNEEIQALQSIYADSVVLDRVLYNGTPCVVIQVTFPDASHGQSTLDIRIVIYNALAYPEDWSRCRILVWVTREGLKPAVARLLAESGISYVQSVEKRGTAVLFDVIQHLQSEMDSVLKSTREGHCVGLPSAEKPQRSAGSGVRKHMEKLRPDADRLSVRGNSERGAADIANEAKHGTSTTKSDRSVQHPIPFPSPASASPQQTNHMDTLEYRTALSRAIGMGLRGQQARDQVCGGGVVMVLRT